MRFCLMLAVAFLPAISASAQELSDEEIRDVQEQVIGPWQLEMSTPEGDLSPVVLVGRQRKELVAWFVDEDRPQKFKSVKLDGEILSLTVEPKKHPGVTVTLNATLAGEGKCTGEAEYETSDGDAGSFSFKGSRIQDRVYDEVQTWELKFDTPDGRTRTPKVKVMAMGERIYAWYSAEDYELPADEVKIDGSDVELKMVIAGPEGGKVTVVFTGEVDEKNVSGDIKFDYQGQTGSVPFTGKRKS